MFYSNVLIGLRKKGTLKCKSSPPSRLKGELIKHKLLRALVSITLYSGNKKAKSFAKQLINRKCKKVKTSCKKSGVKGCSCKFAM